MTKLGPYEVHPLADKFPLLEGEEFDKLVQDIKINGLSQPIVLNHDETVLIDGRNRFRACEAALQDPTFRVLGPHYTEKHLIGFIVSANLARRNLTPGQLGMLATDVEQALAAAAKQAQRQTGTAPGRPKVVDGALPADLPEALHRRERESRTQAARIVGTSPRVVQQAKAVRRDAPDLESKVRSGAMAIDAADRERRLRIAREPKPEPVESKAPTMLTLRTHEGTPVLYPQPKSKPSFNPTPGEGISWAAWSWNPVTGCLHGCDYCLAPDTPVLMADMSWRSIGDLRVGDCVMAFDEERPQWVERRWRTAEVLAVWPTQQTAYRVTFDDGREVVASARHKWLCSPDTWCTTDSLQPGSEVCTVFPPTVIRWNEEYQDGYIVGMIGDVWPPLYCDDVRPMPTVEPGGSANMPAIIELCREQGSDAMWCGWLAGIFESYGDLDRSDGSPLLLHKDMAVLELVAAVGNRLGFTFKVETFNEVTPTLLKRHATTSTARLVGDAVEVNRFVAAMLWKPLGTVAPEAGQRVRTMGATVVSVTPSVDVEMVDITTSTGTFVANGLLTHNCYARELANKTSYAAAYPVGFTPLFHHERLSAPAHTVVPVEHRGDPAWRRVFVCSMADLYGRWVPDDWIAQVHASCAAHPQWDYLLLTKFPSRYVKLDLPPTAWVGTSIDEQKRVRIAEDAFRQIDGVRVKWLSLEPLREPLEFSDLSMFDWVVIGAQTETRQPDGVVPAFAPPLEWVARIVAQAREAGCRVHLKPNLLGRVGPQLPGMTLPDEYPDAARGDLLRVTP